METVLSAMVGRRCGCFPSRMLRTASSRDTRHLPPPCHVPVPLATRDVDACQPDRLGCVATPRQGRLPHVRIEQARPFLDVGQTLARAVHHARPARTSRQRDGTPGSTTRPGSWRIFTEMSQCLSPSSHTKNTGLLRLVIVARLGCGPCGRDLRRRLRGRPAQIRTSDDDSILAPRWSGRALPGGGLPARVDRSFAALDPDSAEGLRVFARTSLGASMRYRAAEVGHFGRTLRCPPNRSLEVGI